MVSCRSGVIRNEPGQAVTKGMARYEANKRSYGSKKERNCEKIDER